MKLNKLDDALEYSTIDAQYESILIRAVEQQRDDIAFKVFERSQNPNLSLQLLLILSSGTADQKDTNAMLEKFASTADKSGQQNLAFLAHLYSGNRQAAMDCLLNQGMMPEAALFARSYMPESVDSCTQKWKDSLIQKGNTKAAEMIGTVDMFPEHF